MKRHGIVALIGLVAACSDREPNWTASTHALLRPSDTTVLSFEFSAEHPQNGLRVCVDGKKIADSMPTTHLALVAASGETKVSFDSRSRRFRVSVRLTPAGSHVDELLRGFGEPTLGPGTASILEPGDKLERRLQELSSSP